jgi:chaperonin cofactor prefoldin
MSDRAEEDRALFELDRGRSHSRQQLLQCRGATQAKIKAKRRAQLCLAEVEQLPAECRTYKAVGRMFLRTPLPKIQSDLNTLIEKSDADLVSLQTQEKRLVAELNAAEAAIAEIMGKDKQ